MCVLRTPINSVIVKFAHRTSQYTNNKTMKEKKIIKLADKVIVEALEKHPKLKAGTKYETHPNQVNYLKEKGYIKVIG